MKSSRNALLRVLSLGCLAVIAASATGYAERPIASDALRGPVTPFSATQVAVLAQPTLTELAQGVVTIENRSDALMTCRVAADSSGVLPVEADGRDVFVAPRNELDGAGARAVIPVEAGAEALYTVRCDQAFTAELVTAGDKEMVAASQLGKQGVITFRQPDVFVPRRGALTRRYAISAPANVRYRVVTLDLDVTPAAWDRDASGLHNLFWMQRGPQWPKNVIGYGNLRGPGKNIVVLSANVDLPRRQMLRVARPGGVNNGRMHVNYRYDTISRVATMTVTQNGSTIHNLPVQVPAVGNLTVGKDLFVELGFEHGGNHGPERPTIGWTYQNLEVKLIP